MNGCKSRMSGVSGVSMQKPRAMPDLECVDASGDLRRG